MSNPFLVDLEESYTPYSASGTQTPYSGAATPKRRNSTNPFEILSPESEDVHFLDNEITNSEVNNEGSGGANVASAIADMTADFYQTISMKPYEFEPADDVFDEEKKLEPFEEFNSRVTTVTTVNFDNDGRGVFDPFETIHDDDATVSSKRSSIEQPKDAPTSTTAEQSRSDFKSAKAKELFNSSMAGIEILAAAATSTAAAAEATSDFSPLTPTTPASGCDNAFLSAPQGMEAYSSDLSELSDVSPTKQTEIRSAFNDFSDNKESMSMESELIKRNLSTTPGENTDAEPIAESMDVKSNKKPCVTHRNLEAIGGDSIDIDFVGNPNKEATGFVNTAFDEVDKQVEDLEMKKRDSVDIAEVQNDNIHPNTVRVLVADEEANPKNEQEVTNNADPFDTSAFDSKAFEAFESRFETAESRVKSTSADPFASPFKTATKSSDSGKNEFDTFEPFVPKQPENTPFRVPKKKKDSFEDSDSDFDDDDEEDNLRIVIKAKMKDSSDTSNTGLAPIPFLPPPPKSPKHMPKSPAEAEEKEEEEEPLNDEDRILMSYKTPGGKARKKATGKSFLDEEFDRFFGNEENRTAGDGAAPEEEHEWPTAFGEASTKRAVRSGDESPASPQTPLYDEDTSQPLEDFPLRYMGDGWELMLRHPAKKKLTANRYWKKIFVKFIPETCLLQLFNKKGDPQPFQELPLQASYSLSEISAQQYDQYGKIFTIKVQYIFYRERVGVRPGQIAKVMQGQIQSMGDFARLGMPVEHAPQVSELLKLGSLEYADLKELVQEVEESMFRMTVHRDRALTYRTEEIQCCVQDELYVEQNKIGIIEKQLARVRIFFLAFINGMPAIEVGINDLRRQGKEVVGRHDILPVVTEEWIRVEAQEFHSCVESDVFDSSQIVKLVPPDACHFELMRFRIRPPKNRELPLQVTAHMNITPTKMELKCDILVPGCISRKHGQIPCEDIQIRFHIPECWIYFFRVEKHFRYGAVHSTNRRSGKLKGFERILGTAANPDPQLIEVTAGMAKYEHAYHSIVWRIPKLPKEGQGAYTQQLMLVRLPLSSFDRIPETFYDYVHVEFHMPSTTVSHTTLRSISVSSENPPEKFVRYLAKYEYKINLNITYDDSKPDPEYVAATSSLNNGSVKNLSQEPNSSEEEADNNDD